MKKIKTMNKKAQVTIFIIIALIIVVVIALIFLIRSPPKVQAIDEKSPSQYIETCTKDALNDALKQVLINAGGVSPSLSVMYNSQTFSYLCYTNEFYQKCVNQRPKLIEYIESNITQYITPRINACFDSLDSSLNKKYDISMGELVVNTILEPKKVNVVINRKFKMIHGSDVKEFNVFKIELVHPIYDLASVATEIVNQEAVFCNFDNLGYMIIYPDYDINKFKTGNSDIIYKVTERRSGKEFDFASRSCVLPAGF